MVPPHAGGRDSNQLQVAWDEGELFPSPHAGRAREGLSLVPIENIHSDDHVLAHDGSVHRVICTFRHLYRGALIGLMHAYSSKTLWLTADHNVLVVPTPRSLGGHTDWSGIPKPLRGRSRLLRREMTLPERKLWRFLRRNRMQVTFRRQHPIGRYIADFYSRSARLVVEVDGAAAHDGEEAEAHDAARDAYLESLGLRVVHVPAKEVLYNIEGVLVWLQEVCREQFSLQKAVWLPAGELWPGDLVFFNADPQGVELVSVERVIAEEEVYDLVIEDINAFVTEVCAVQGRRWHTGSTT